jgi:Carboxypeptidase regulatory-like domain
MPFRFIKAGENKVVSLLAIALTISATAGQSATMGKLVIGTVADQAGAGIPNAVVELLAERDEKLIARAESGPEGRFKIRAEFSAPVKVRVTARGFASMTERVKGPGAELDLGKIRLKVNCSGPGVICDEIVPQTKKPDPKR